MTYRVKEGQHQDDSGHTYSKGDIVESDLDLLKLFPEKFALINGDEEEVDPDATQEGQLGDDTKKAGTRVKDTGRTQKSAHRFTGSRTFVPKEPAAKSKSSKSTTEDDDDDE